MNYQTELMRAILTSTKAQEMVDFVPPVYGDSYVGLWMFQAEGHLFDIIYEIALRLRQEVSPATADWLLDMWEDSYGIPRNHSLTVEQRRERIINWRTRGPCNPHRLAAAVSSALNGVEVDIQENIAKNTFLVNVREGVYDWEPIIDTLERKKPAHLIYVIRVCTQMVSEPPVKVALGLTHCENFKVEVMS